MTAIGDDEFSKLLSDSQADFERDLMSFKKREEVAPAESVPAPSLAISIAEPNADSASSVVAESSYGDTPLKSPEGRDKRVWSSHPKSRMR